MVVRESEVSERMLRFLFEQQMEKKPFTYGGKSGEKTSTCEKIQTSVVDILSLRCLRDNQMEMSRWYKL